MKVLENNEVKLLWDVSIQTEKRLERNKPDIVVLYKKQKVYLVNDVACPFDNRINKKGQEKIEDYTDLKYEILKCWNKEVDKVMILPIGSLGTVTKNSLCSFTFSHKLFTTIYFLFFFSLSAPFYVLFFQISPIRSLISRGFRSTPWYILIFSCSYPHTEYDSSMSRNV